MRGWGGRGGGGKKEGGERRKRMEGKAMKKGSRTRGKQGKGGGRGNEGFCALCRNVNLSATKEDLQTLGQTRPRSYPDVGCGETFSEEQRSRISIHLRPVNQL